MKDIEARIIEYLAADTSIKAVTTDIRVEKLPLVVADKTITVRANYDESHPVFDTEMVSIIIKVWVNVRSPLISEPAKILKDLSYLVISALNLEGDHLTKSSGGWDLSVYSCRKLGRVDDMNESEKLWSSIITFELIKDE